MGFFVRAWLGNFGKLGTLPVRAVAVGQVATLVARQGLPGVACRLGGGALVWQALASATPCAAKQGRQGANLPSLGGKGLRRQGPRPPGSLVYPSGHCLPTLAGKHLPAGCHTRVACSVLVL